MTVIQAKQGKLKGLAGPRSTTFYAIPYAAPPTGSLRWRPPEPGSPWSGVRDATNHPNRSWQPAWPQTLGGRVNPGAMSEDMLYLNIYTPGADGRRRPILVYIHGGGYVGGSANDFDPTPFAVRHDVVVVSMNYRLGVFGFFDLSRLGDAYNGSASLGFQDQIAALRWIGEHIADFGGDPDDITISGVSAGAGSVLALMCAPTAQGCFRKAIAFSPGEIAREPPDLLGFFARILKRDEASTFAHLSSLSGEALFRLFHENGATMAACVDGVIIQKPADQGLREATTVTPLLVGTCINEGVMMVPTVAEDANLDAEAMTSDMHVRIGAGDAARYQAFLRDLLPDASRGEIMSRIWYDYFRSLAVRAADACASRDNPAWLYSFEAPTDHPFGPTHASDMAFSYNLFDSGIVAENEYLGFHRNTAINRSLAHLWTDAVARFVRTGDPNGDGFPHWPAYHRRHQASLALRDAPYIVQGYDGVRACAAYGLVTDS